MAVRIRLTRYGKKNRPFFRIAVFDSRTRRDGRFLENLGTFDPLVQDESKKIVIQADRLQDWIRRGAKPTVKLEKLLAHCGVPAAAAKPAAPPAVKPEPKAGKQPPKS
jgi:small subunit ribosomal protein S16